MDFLNRSDKTIIQLSTPRAEGAVHIIRISGAGSLGFLFQHTELEIAPMPRKLVHAAFYEVGQATGGGGSAVGISDIIGEGASHSASTSTSSLVSDSTSPLASASGTTETFTSPSNTMRGDLLDRILCVYFPGPHSYTGEDVVELHTHGSLLIVDRILASALRMGLLLAERGEFTYRAFLNRRLNLEQAEAVNALIVAKSTQTHANALNILERKTAFRFEALHKELLGMLAQLESTIEFPEEDIPEIETDRETLYKEYDAAFRRIRRYFLTILENYQVGMKMETGIRVVIMGLPNVGKSTLMNALLRNDRALVSPVAGTTRDYIEESIELAGVRFVLTDTAGLHETNDPLEAAGIKRTRERIAQADICIFLIACDTANSNSNPNEAEVAANRDSKKSSWDHLYEQVATLSAQRESAVGTMGTMETTDAMDTTSAVSSGGRRRHNILYINKADLNKVDFMSGGLGEDFKKNLSNLSLASRDSNGQGLEVTGIFSLMEDKESAIKCVEADLIKYGQSHSESYQQTTTQSLESDEAPVALLNLRQAKVAEKIISGLDGMLIMTEQGESEEVLAEEFRLLNDYFSELGLALSHERVYDTLFSHFCIGK